MAAEAAIARNPNMAAGMRANRAVMRRMTAYLAGEAGINQFLDIGTGLPTSPNMHEIAQRIAPESRVVYVDNDPIVLVHARALLTSTAEGACTYIDADARDPEKILADPKLSATIDLSKPVALSESVERRRVTAASRAETARGDGGQARTSSRANRATGLTVSQPGLYWRQIAEQAAATGLQPILLSGLLGSTERPWDLGEFENPGDVADIDQCDPAILLAEVWEGHEPSPDELDADSAEWWADYNAMFEPYGADFPGLAPAIDSDIEPLRLQIALGQYLSPARIGLVPAVRPADVLTRLGWTGVTNRGWTSGQRPSWPAGRA
jgi:hypothetical protein